MTTSIHIIAELPQGCTAGCGKLIEVGMSITPGESGWQHSSCWRAGTRPRRGSATMIEDSDRGAGLERRLNEHRGDLSADELSYVEDMIRRRRVP